MQTEPDPDHWNAWLQTHARQFLLYARQQTRFESAAEGVLQDALVEAWRRCGGAEPPPALVYATIRRRAIDLARSHDARGVPRAIRGKRALVRGGLYPA